MAAAAAAVEEETLGWEAYTILFRRYLSLTVNSLALGMRTP
jgi:hypothetical protein